MLNEANKLDPDISELCYTAFAMDANESSIEELLQYYERTKINDERLKILSSLGRVKCAEIIERVLDFMMSDQVQPKNIIIILKSLTESCVGRKAAWNYFMTNQQKFLTKCKDDEVCTHILYSSSGFKISYMFQILGEIIFALITKFCTEEDAEQISNYFQENPILEIQIYIYEGICNIKKNIVRLNRDRQKLCAYFKAYNQSI